MSDTDAQIGVGVRAYSSHLISAGGVQSASLDKLVMMLYDKLYEDRKTNPSIDGCQSRTIIGDWEYEAVLRIESERAQIFGVGAPVLPDHNYLTALAIQSFKVVSEYAVDATDTDKPKAETKFWLDGKLFYFHLARTGKAGEANLSVLL